MVDPSWPATPSQPGMQTSLVAATVTFAVARGLPMERITQATGLTFNDLIEPQGRLPERALPTVWRLLSEAYPGEALALEMASVAPFSYFGSLLHAARYADTFGDAVRVFVRYRRVLSDRLHVATVASDDEVAIVIHHPNDALDGGFGAEVGLGIASRFIREILGEEESAERMEFVHQPFGPLAAYEDFFGVPVRFGCPQNAVVARRAVLDRPNRLRDATRYSFLQGHLDLVAERLAARAESNEMSRVRESIARNAERSEYGAEPLARRLGMSLRSLQRLTRAHGTSVRALLEEAREANARQLLSDPRLSVEEIAFLLGYAEDRAFRRAFKRWTGHTPAQLRRVGG
ncbi:MAG: AraC family transcriptional regulator ligand-binding domain-containing protein [Alphaproteobacteria bacterium]|nr:AraC family transcriptional regulator ligand-binding domain-containing protein [Alphaproteobacteria bacterium]